MRRLFLLTLVLTLSARPAQAYIDITSSLGDVIKDSSAIALLRVEKVSQEKRVIVFKKIADLKGKSAGDVRHHIAEGFHPREPKIVMEWAEPGKLAICFTTGVISLVCIGNYWYDCAALEVVVQTLLQLIPKDAASPTALPYPNSVHVDSMKPQTPYRL